MRLTNFLLIILIALVAFQKLPLKEERNVPLKKEQSGIVFGKKDLTTKNVRAESTKKDDVKHSSTFRQYANSDGRTTTSLSHNIRIGKDYWISSGVDVTQSSYGQDAVGVSASIVKFW